MYQAKIYARDRQYRTLRCHWENVYVYDDRLWLDRHLILRNQRMRRNLLLMLTAVVVFVPSMLGCLIYRIRGFEDLGHLFGFDQPSASTNAYNDRVGRAVEPHASWVEHGHRWQSPQRGLRLFSAHYHLELGAASCKPASSTGTIRTPFRPDLSRAEGCPDPRKTETPAPRSGGCMTQFSSSPRVNRTTACRSPCPSGLVKTANLMCGSPSTRRSSSLSATGNSIAVCIRVDSGSPERVSDLAEWYRSRGARQVTAYGVANGRNGAAVKAPSFKGEFVPWYDPEVLADVSDVTAMSLMLRDCALRSSATSKCVAFLGVDDVLVVESRGSRAKCCMRDPRLLRLCENSGVVFVDHRDVASPCEGFAATNDFSLGQDWSQRHSPGTPFRRCVNGTAREAALFRVDDGLLDGSTAVDKGAIAPLSIATLRSFASARREDRTSHSEILQTSA
ncbi:hypothetical protein MTO96_035534 [Rhipicephalus appendiculatus]